MNTRQFFVLSALLAVSAAATAPWMGPFADHMLGQLVADTAEVAAAKRHHAEAHSQVRSILPELPQEERFPDDPRPVIVPQHPVAAPHQHHVVASHQHHAAIPYQHHVGPVMVNPQFTQFAEEIPRSQLGETPEVEAARNAHLRAFMEVRAALPVLNDELVTRPPVRAAPVMVPAGYLPADTPEVAEARREHARAYAKTLSLLQ